jgi:hypothetical protein
LNFTLLSIGDVVDYVGRQLSPRKPPLFLTCRHYKALALIGRGFVYLPQLASSIVKIMANMGYCRFQNTLSDLRDCLEHLDDDDLSEEEQNARKRLIKVCKQVVEYSCDEEED